MLKRLSSLVLVLIVGGSVFANSARLTSLHVCKMAGVEMMLTMENMPDMEVSGTEMMAAERIAGMDLEGMETIPCCLKSLAAAATRELIDMRLCCVTTPQEQGSTTVTPVQRGSTFSIAIMHAAVVQLPAIGPKLHARHETRRVFLPNLQSSYLRNLSFLI